MNRIADATRTCNRLKLFWNKAQTRIVWEIRVFQAITQSKLLYGLEAIQLNQTELAKLHAFQMKCYRRILHIPPTSIDRSWTNQAVTDLLEQQHRVTVTTCSRLWMLRKTKLLGHTVRSDSSDPTRQVLLQPHTLIPRIEHTRRVGKPRAHWLIQTYSEAYHETGGMGQFNIDNIQHRNQVNTLAKQRLGIFAS